MATILPNNPAGSFPPETLRVFRLLKGLPDCYTIWQRLGAQARPGPDFWVRRADGRSALIAITSASQSAVRAARQNSLFGQVAPPGAAEQAALLAFLGEVSYPDGDAHAARAHHHRDIIDTSPARGGGRGEGYIIPALLLFPLVARAELEQSLDPPPPGIAYGAKDELAPEVFPAWLEGRLSQPLSLAQTETLRRAFTPEVVIPAQLSVRKPILRDTAAGLTDYLLSYSQERALKHDLDLSDEAAAAGDDTQLQLVSGVAGSGKSLILLYRARLLRQFFPRKRMLVLTHNRPLILDLQRRYMLLSGGDRGVEWRTFHSWCQRHWPDGERRPQLACAGDRRAIVERARHEHLAGTSVSPELLQDEIAWLKDRLITTRQGYLEADRAGRGFGLNEAMRERMYAAILAYQRELQARDLADYGDVPRRIWRAMIEEGAAFPQYDFILIDEAQFFAPIWFEIVKHILAPRHGRLFIVADPTQGFLRRRQSWLASGLSVRGRSQRLETCYRTTREILEFASRFYQLRLPADDEAQIAANLQHTPAGARPELIALGSEQDEIARAVNEIRALERRGVPLEHILVIHADWRGAARLHDRLRAEFGDARVAHPRQHAGSHHVRVCALDAATGLESPIVFLLGAHRLIEAEGSLRIAEEERAERLRDNTRRLYMAMTRAGQRLVLTYVGQPPPALLPAGYAAL